jgi:hypothetical protein
MKRIRIMGFALITALAASTFVAVAASASNKCLTPTTTAKKGTYDWEPGPGAAGKFYGVAIEPEPLLETVGHKKISCSVGIFKGEYTGPKTETVKITLSGCLNSEGHECQSSPESAGTVESETLAGELEFVSGKGSKKPIVGWDLKHEGTLFTYECGLNLKEVGTPVFSTIEGSVIGPVAYGSESDMNKMSLTSIIKYKAVDGKQAPEKFEGGLADTLTTITTGLSELKEQTGLTGTDRSESGVGEVHEKPENQENLEILSRCLGSGC